MAGGVGGADPADQLVRRAVQLGDPFSAMLDEGQDRLASRCGDRDHAGVGHRLAEQLQPGVRFGLGGDSQELPVGVEDLVARAVGQQLSGLLNPQCRELKRVVHTGEYAVLARPGDGRPREHSGRAVQPAGPPAPAPRGAPPRLPFPPPCGSVTALWLLGPASASRPSFYCRCETAHYLGITIIGSGCTGGRLSRHVITACSRAFPRSGRPGPARAGAGGGAAQIAPPPRQKGQP